VALKTRNGKRDRNQEPPERVPGISATEAVILSRLLEASGREMYGLELVKESHGLLKRGSVYVLLDRLEDKRFVESRAVQAREDQSNPLPRRVYRVTGLGQKAMAARDAYRMVFA
jgi:DNA-binding PadR family transcriptional regulator